MAASSPATPALMAAPPQSDPSPLRILHPARHALDRAHGVPLSFDEIDGYQPRRLRVLWLENKLDCRTWSYYCDIRDAMARLHDLCTPRSGDGCVGPGGRRPSWSADIAVVGPRYSINIMTDDDPVGFNRSQYAHLPLFVIQNKMYEPQGWREIVGNVTGKLAWVRTSGAVGAFTWLTRHHEFTQRSGVPHYWLPFGVDATKYGRFSGTFGPNAQPFDVGFTGASGADKYPLRAAALRELEAMDIKMYTGTWLQSALNRADNRSWKPGNHNEYAQRMARAKLWVSTTGPESLVGTRYFEVLASGTTLLLCNRPNVSATGDRWVYDGLFEDGEHVAMFGDVAELRAKVNHYLNNEADRRRVVQNAHALTLRRHTWDSRARFITKLAELALEEQGRTKKPYYTAAPPQPSSRKPPRFAGCFALPKAKKATPSFRHFHEPPRSRNKRRLRRYTVQLCQTSCRGRAFLLLGGGFVSGNGHADAYCMCATNRRAQLEGLRERPASECATTCSLRDSRPCGGSSSAAVYVYS